MDAMMAPPRWTTEALRLGSRSPLQIAARRVAEGAAEHGDEGARTLVAEVEGDRRHRRALGQARDGGGAAQALAPAAGGHAGLLHRELGRGAGREMGGQYE